MSEVPYGAPIDDAWIEDASLPTLKRTHYLERVFGEEPPQGYAEWIKSLSLTSVEMEYFKRRLLGQLIDKLLITGVVPFTSDLPQDGNNNGDIWFVESDGHAHLWLDGNYYDLGDLKGVKGDQGIQGIQGEAGPIGLTGAQGIQGIKGDKGDTGAQGIQGPKGDTGLTGPKGDQGIQGIPGNDGADGTSVTIKGSVTTSAELPTTGNSNGDGWITQGDGHLHVWNGTAFVDVGLVRGPKGDKGDTGAQGIQGIQGIPGAKGDKGDQGIQGIQGIKGDKGDTGDKGDIGLTGATGAGVYFEDKAFTDPPTAYKDGTTYTNGSTALGWPVNFLTVITEKRAWGRTIQRISSVDKTFNGIRTDQSGSWTPIKQVAYTDTATTSANGLMSADDKLKLDRATSYNLSGERLVKRNALGSFNVTDPTEAYNPMTMGYAENNFVRAVDSYELFVNPTTGADTNAGTSTAPFKTLKAAIDLAMTKSVKPDNVATINLAAGTYRERIVMPDRTPFPYVLHIKGANVGGHPNVPTTVFSEGEGTRAICFINRNQMARIILEDIKFHGYNGTSSSGGVTNVDGNIKTVNCHFDRCYYGLSSFHGSLEARSGLFTNNGNLATEAGSGAGIRSMMHNRHTIGIQNAGERSRTPVFDNNVAGIIAQENATGHADYCTFTNNLRGITCNISSRVNATGSYFSGNSTAIYGAFSSNFFLTSDTLFVVSGTQKVADLLSNSTVIGTGKVFNGGATTAGAKSESIVSGDYDEKTVNATASTPVFEATLAPNWFREGFRISGQGCMSARTVTSITLTSGSAPKRISVRHFGLNQEILFANTESGNRRIETEIRFVSETRQLVEIRVFGNMINPRYYFATRNVNMTVDQPVRIDASVDSSSDSIKVNFSEMYSIF